MSTVIEDRVRAWIPPVLVGLIIGAVCAGLVVSQGVPPMHATAPAAAAVAAPEPPSATSFRRFEVPIALVEPTSGTSVIVTPTELRWTTADGDFIVVQAGGTDDPFAPHWGTTVTDRGTRTVAGVTASLGTVLPRRPSRADQVQVRIATFTLGDRPIRVMARTSSVMPDVRVLADFEAALASLRVLVR